LFLGLLLALYTFNNAWALDLKASWYSVSELKRDGQWKLTKGVMANGKIFTDEGQTCASWDFPLNTRLRIRNVSTGHDVFVTNTDRTARRFKGKRIDLPKGAFNQLAPLKQGLINVQVEIVK
jgi:rare lipoprotein A (peptidoglycan hydrolase)